MKLKKLALMLSAVLTFQLVGTPAQAWYEDSSEDDFGSKLYKISLYYNSDYGQFDNPNDNPDIDSPVLTLTIRCSDKTLDIFTLGIIPSTGYSRFFSAKQKRVDVRFNGGAVSTWSVSASPAGISYLNEKAFIGKLYKAKSFSVRIATPTGLTMSATYQLGNLSTYKRALANAGCRT